MADEQILALLTEFRNLQTLRFNQPVGTSSADITML